MAWTHGTYVRRFDHPAELEKEMAALGVDAVGVGLMKPKGDFLTLKVHQVSLRAANILKQEMLALGGEAAVHKEVSMLAKEWSDVLLMGNRKQLERLVKKLRMQPFGLKEMAQELEWVLQGLDRSRRPLVIAGKGWQLDCGKKTLVMGILNVTPDSFSDGGQWLDPDAAVARAQEMVEQGADIIDVGGESTRPGHVPISAEEEIRRVEPVIRRLKATVDVPISIDTYKPEVALRALAAGADLINDIWGFKRHPEMAKVAAETGVPVILQHNRPPERAEYADVMGEIIQELRDSIDIGRKAGVKDEQVILDPGIGFGKRLEYNLEVMRRLDELVALGYPVLVGTSRKSFIGQTLQLPVHDRLEGTAATVALAVAKGCHIVRVHDVKEMVRVTRMMDAMLKSWWMADGQN